jgi:hypothetical protein
VKEKIKPFSIATFFWYGKMANNPPDNVNEHILCIWRDRREKGGNGVKQ